jgi:restriction endonuclease S subunit
LGKTTNIPDRDKQMATQEVTRGFFYPVFEVSYKDLGTVERLLKDEFLDYLIQYDAGTEFYNKKIILLIEPCLIRNGISYRKLTKEEIGGLEKPHLVISKEDFYNLMIPVPSLKQQEKIVEDCEHIDTLIIMLEKEIENDKKKASQIFTSRQLNPR